jgi:hypothetical protein
MVDYPSYEDNGCEAGVKLCCRKTVLRAGSDICTVTSSAPLVPVLTIAGAEFGQRGAWVSIVMDIVSEIA